MTNSKLLTTALILLLTLMLPMIAQSESNILIPIVYTSDLRGNILPCQH